MSRQEFSLLMELALVVRGLAAPDDRRSIDRRIEALLFGDKAPVIAAKVWPEPEAK